MLIADLQDFGFWAVEWRPPALVKPVGLTRDFCFDLIVIVDFDCWFLIVDFECWFVSLCSTGWCDGRQLLFSRWWVRLGTCCSGPASVFGLWPKPSEPASDLHSSSFHTPLDLRLMAVAPSAWLQYYLSSAWLQLYLSLWEVLRRMLGCNITSHLKTSHHTLYIRGCLGKTLNRLTALHCIRPVLKSMSPIFLKSWKDTAKVL